MKSSLLSFIEALALSCQEPRSLMEALIHGDTTEQFISGSLLLRPRWFILLSNGNGSAL